MNVLNNIIFGIEYKKPANRILNHKFYYNKVSLISSMLTSNNEFVIIDINLLKILNEKGRFNKTA